MQKNGYGSYAFDAILTFGLALNNLILDDPSSVESINKVETLRCNLLLINYNLLSSNKDLDLNIYIGSCENMLWL